VVLSLASHEGLGANKASTQDAGNLQALLAISIGCRAMLTENVWAQRGLVNGSIGVVEEVVWAADSIPLKTRLWRF
jgi:ATP-dependent DNA helicase PIF1